MNSFQYYVVKLQSNPHPTVPEYIAVSETWIRSNSPDKRVAVSYPPEHLHAAIGRIKAAEPYNDKWPILMGDEKLGCDDLSEALKSAVDMNKKSRSHNKKKQEFVKPKQTAKRSMDRAASVDNTPPQGGDKVRKITPLQETTSNPDNERDATNIAMEMAYLFKEMAEAFETAIPILDEMCKTGDDIKATLKNAEKITNEFINSRNRKTGGTKRVSQRSPSTSKDNEKTYVFPDNSDTNSKWTLRHKGPGEGLTELLRGSGVYVDAAKLKSVESINFDLLSGFKQDYLLLRTARVLLEEIFSDHALGVCTLHGGLGHRNRDSPDVPPGLDNYSREVLMMYIHEYCQERNLYFDKKQIKATLGNKLLEHRKIKKTPY